MILTEKKLRNIIKKTILEAMDDSFSYDELSSLRYFTERVNYCKKHLGLPIGNGSSRMVFQIDDEKCLKLARNPKGIAQNEAEFDWYAQNYGILPHIYESADDKSWILVEYVIPAKAKDIKMCLGVDFNTFQRFVDTAYCYYSGEIDCYNQLPDDEFSEMCENNKWFESLYNYMADYQLPSGDLKRLANLGMVLRDGQPQIVILDSGLTQQIYDEYYRR